MKVLKHFGFVAGFIGYASDVYALVADSAIQDSDDDQLYYTKLYLDAAKREKHGIKLDHKSQIFQNINGALGKPCRFVLWLLVIFCRPAFHVT